MLSPSRRNKKDRLSSIGIQDKGQLISAPVARACLRRGFDTVGNALRCTLGPTSRTVLIEDIVRTNPPEILNDGATVAQRIVELPLYYNSGGMLMRHLAWRVLNRVGDGSATAAVIAQAVLREATRCIAAGANPALLREGIESGLPLALAAIDALATSADDLDSIYQVALAACHDEAIARKIAEIYLRYGLDITIVVQEHVATGLSFEKADGWKWDGGFASPEFITDAPRNLAWAENPYVLITNVWLERAEQVIPIMQQVAGAGNGPLVIIAPKIDGQALATLLTNKRSGVLQSLGLRAPGLGEHREAVMHDLAAQTGARMIDEKCGAKVENAKLEDLGRCQLAWASRDFFALIGGASDPERVSERVRRTRAMLEREEVDHERELIRKRLGNLTGGIAVLNVGAPTKTELAERKMRADRAVKAVEAARHDGVVPGGGVALVAAAQAIRLDGLSLDQRMGRQILVAAMEEPLKVIVENSGAEPAPAVYHVKEGKGRLAYDAVYGDIVDVYEAGILDPINVVKTALKSGVSAGVMAMMTEAIVIPRFRLLHADPHP